MTRLNLEFASSGSGANDAMGVNMAYRTIRPNELEPARAYASWISLRTVVWGVGLSAFVLNVLAMYKLDFLNVLLLLPSLLFSVSTLAVPFLMAPLRGKHIGAASLVPRILGWGAALLVYVLAVALIAKLGWFSWFGCAILGALILLFVFTVIAFHGLKHLLYPRGLNIALRKFADRLGFENEEDKWDQVIFKCLKNPRNVEEALASPDLARNIVLEYAKHWETIALPVLEQPALEKAEPPHNRSFRYFSRSFVTGMFTFVWFLIVQSRDYCTWAPRTIGYIYHCNTAVCILVLLTLPLLGISLAHIWDSLRCNEVAREAKLHCAKMFDLSNTGNHENQARLFALLSNVQVSLDQKDFASIECSLAAMSKPISQASRIRLAGKDSSKRERPDNVND